MYEELVLYIDSVSSSNCVSSNDRMNNELDMIWKKSVVAHFKALYREFFGGTEVNHDKPVSVAGLCSEI
jgi:hypothetical protein